MVTISGVSAHERSRSSLGGLLRLLHNTGHGLIFLLKIAHWPLWVLKFFRAGDWREPVGLFFLLVSIAATVSLFSVYAHFATLWLDMSSGHPTVLIVVEFLRTSSPFLLIIPYAAACVGYAAVILYFLLRRED